MRVWHLAAALLVLSLAAVEAPPASAHGGGTGGGFFRGVGNVRAVGPWAWRAPRVFPRYRGSIPAWRFRRPGWNGGRDWNAGGSWGGAIFAPLAILPPDPPGYGDGFVDPRLPAIRECVSETRMVPSSTHPGVTPVAVTRCWRRN